MGVIFDPLLRKLRTSDASGGDGNLRGNWDADTNTPDITAENTPGDYWVVSVAGATDLNGITTWNVGDIARVASTGDFARIPIQIAGADYFTFTSANLVSGVLSIEHELDQTGALPYAFADQNGVAVEPVVTFVDKDNFTADFGDLTITGTWSGSILSRGGTSTGSDISGTPSEGMTIRYGVAGQEYVDAGSQLFTEITDDADLALAHIRLGLLVANKATAITLTVKPHATTAYSEYSTIVIENKGAGDLTLTVDTGVTLNGVATGSITISQYQAGYLRRVSEDNWVMPNFEVV